MSFVLINSKYSNVAVRFPPSPPFFFGHSPLQARICAWYLALIPFYCQSINIVKDKVKPNKKNSPAARKPPHSSLRPKTDERRPAQQQADEAVQGKKGLIEAAQILGRKQGVLHHQQQGSENGRQPIA